VSFGDVVSIGQQAIFVALLAAAPVLLLSMVVGLTVSIFQAVTQIFILALLTDFTARIFSGLPAFVK
jgi:flagellar biosynthesis protein FliQ